MRVVLLVVPEPLLLRYILQRTSLFRAKISSGVLSIASASEPRKDGYQSNGSDERRLAREYYDRVGYPHLHD